MEKCQGKTRCPPYFVRATPCNNRAKFICTWKDHPQKFHACGIHANQKRREGWKVEKIANYRLSDLSTQENK